MREEVRTCAEVALIFLRGAGEVLPRRDGSAAEKASIFGLVRFPTAGSARRQSDVWYQTTTERLCKKQEERVETDKKPWSRPGFEPTTSRAPASNPTLKPPLSL
ncbi:hypothetical protein Bbelb_025730 [Branchiostoma belcheri]|nr:hypothetical protein Bbelb_025730 [Branchiostoma belcheri]